MSKPESWKTWQGRSVTGKFPLRHWLGGSDHSAVFITERPGGAKAAIKLVAVDPANAEQELTRIRAITRLSNPHLIRIFEAGRAQIEGDSFIYVVMELADEDLGQILPQRALAPDEVSDLLPPVLNAVSYLHSKGFVHSRIKPSNVLAVANQLKLSADQITPLAETGPARRRDVYDAPETAAGIVSSASDVWSVGVTLVAALTQNVTLAEQTSPGSRSLPETIPEPYRSIVRECLQLDPKRRSSVQQIQRRLQPAELPLPAAPKPSVPAATAAPIRPASSRPNRKPMIAIAGVLVAIVIIFALVHSRGNNSRPVPAAESTPPPVAESKPSPAPETPTRNPAVPPPTRSRSTGAITRQVLPDIPKSAKNTIRGTIKISVHVDVSPSGKVIGAKLKNAGPSRYFAQKTLKAAEQWEFSPQPDTSSWLLNFRLRRNEIDATPEMLSR